MSAHDLRPILCLYCKRWFATHQDAEQHMRRCRQQGSFVPAPQNAIPQRGEPLGKIEGQQGRELPSDPPGGRRVAPSDGVSGQ